MGWTCGDWLKTAPASQSPRDGWQHLNISFVQCPDFSLWLLSVTGKWNIFYSILFYSILFFKLICFPTPVIHHYLLLTYPLVTFFPFCIILPFDFNFNWFFPFSFIGSFLFLSCFFLFLSHFPLSFQFPIFSHKRHLGRGNLFSDTKWHSHCHCY